MEPLRNILWKREKSKRSDSYIDIFDIKQHKVCLNKAKSIFSTADPEEKNNRQSNAFRKDGKILFGLKKYANAMKKFNCSLRLAEPGSEELGIAYANRSSCFFHMNMLEECLIDLELARESNYPKHLMHKLETRKFICRAIIKKEGNASKRFAVHEPILSFDEHRTYNGVADCLEIQRNNEFGRHVVTKSDLEIGTTILIERPYRIVGCKNTNLGRDRCAKCFKEFKNFVPCNSCITLMFCHDECMHENLHEFECYLPESKIQTFKVGLMHSLLFKVVRDFPDVDILMKTVDFLLKGEEVHDLTIAQRDFCRIFQLSHNHDKQSSKELENVTLCMCTCIYAPILQKPEFKKKFSTGKYRRFLQHLILHFFHVTDHAIELYQNFIREEDDSLKSCATQQYASAMYPFACYINHSCIPNVVTFSIDDRLICKVIRPIKKGEQIFRSYFSNQCSMKRDEQETAVLANRYHFQCDCLLCSNEYWSILSLGINCRMDLLYNDAITPVFMTIKALRELSPVDFEKHEKAAIEFLKKFDNIHPVNDTIAIQLTLQLLWTLFASRFNFPSRELSNSNYITKLDGEILFPPEDYNP